MKHIHKNYIRIFIGIFSIIILSALLFTNEASAAGLSAGDSSSQKVVYDGQNEIFDALSNKTSFSNLVLESANVQNQIQGQNKASATVKISYIAQSYEFDTVKNEAVNVDTKYGDEKSAFTLISNEKNIGHITPDNIGSKFLEAYQSVQKNSTQTTYYTIVMVLHSTYDQNQLVRLYNNEVTEKPLSLEADEKVFIRMMSVGGNLSVTGIESNILQINGPSNFAANINYSSLSANSKNFSIAICNPTIVTIEEITKDMPSNSRIVQPLNLPETYLFLSYKPILLEKTNLTPDNIYKNGGVDRDLGSSINRLYASYLTPDAAGFPVTTSSESSSSPVSQPSSFTSSSQSTSSSFSSNMNSKIPSSTPSLVTSSSSSSSSSSASSTGGTLFGNTSGNLSSILNSDPTTDTLFAQKTTLGNLASNLFTDAEVEEAIGGGMDISKWADNNTDILSLGNLDDSGTGKSLKDTLFSGNWLIAIILGFLTIVLIIISVPLAWKFIKKGSDDDLIR